ncbi:MAG: F0F1 ATP synthase subunit delta [Gammaproteobacteria bacterium]|nr:F0F1 ATP synthase subunit delta [Gammaproteobacteria bacterium]
MSTQITLARPYAKAIFRQAKQAGKVDLWSEWLAYLELLIGHADMQSFIQSPKYSKQEVTDVLTGFLDGQVDSEAKNLVALLTDNKRLQIIPDIKQLYDQFKAAEEGSVSVHVTVPYALQDQEQKAIESALKAALDKSVELESDIDPSIIGGVIIRAGDQVIDGSVLGNLNRLEKIL